MWAASEALPQRRRRDGDRGSNKDINSTKDAPLEDRDEGSRSIVEQNSHLRASAEPGCSYECKLGLAAISSTKPILSMANCILHASQSCYSADLDHTADIQIHACEPLRQASQHGRITPFPLGRRAATNCLLHLLQRLLLPLYFLLESLLGSMQGAPILRQPLQIQHWQCSIT